MWLMTKRSSSYYLNKAESLFKERSYKAALRCCKKALKVGDASVYFLMGRCNQELALRASIRHYYKYRYEAERCFKYAQSLGLKGEVTFYLAQLHYSITEKELYIKELEQSIEEGYEPALFYLLKFVVRYGADNISTKIKYYILAIEKGLDKDGKMSFEVAKSLYSGVGTEKNIEQALVYLDKAIKQGYLDAYILKASILLPIDLAMCFECIKEAELAGNDTAKKIMVIRDISIDNMYEHAVNSIKLFEKHEYKKEDYDKDLDFYIKNKESDFRKFIIAESIIVGKMKNKYMSDLAYCFDHPYFSESLFFPMPDYKSKFQEKFVDVNPVYINYFIKDSIIKYSDVLDKEFKLFKMLTDPVFISRYSRLCDYLYAFISEVNEIKAREEAAKEAAAEAAQARYEQSLKEQSHEYSSCSESDDIPDWMTDSPRYFDVETEIGTVHYDSSTGHATDDDGNEYYYDSWSESFIPRP